MLAMLEVFLIIEYIIYAKTVWQVLCEVKHMTSEKAVKIVKSSMLMHSYLYSAEDLEEAFNLTIKALDQSGWIPVRRRLPNHDEYIKNNGLFNVSDGNRSYSEWFDIYGKQRFGEPTMNGFRVDRCVTAWKPLPEPYKEGSDAL